MASVTVTLVAQCSGNCHLTFDATGAKTFSGVQMALDDITAPVTDDEARAFIKVIAKLVKAGKTAAQAAAVMQAGFTVTG